MIAGLFFMLLFSALPIAVVAGMVSIVMVRRRAEDGADGWESDAGIGTVRRLFIYGLALLGLIFTAVGVSLLIGGMLEVLFEQLVVSQHSQSLSIALAFTLVGTPAWLVFALLAQRSVRTHPVELRSDARRLYFVLARGIAISVVAANAITAARMLLRAQDFSASPWGWLVAWGGVWLVHQQLVALEQPLTAVTRLLERLYLYFGTILGLFLLLGGAVAILSASLSPIYDALFGGSLVSTAWTHGLRTAAAAALVGIVVWSWHWLRNLVARDRLTTLWYVQVFVFGTLPGVAMTVVPVAVLLYRVLQWAAHASQMASASAQFAETPALLATLILGVTTWGYHRAVLTDAPAAQHRQNEPERIYRYLVTVAGLFTLVLGVATLLALAAESLGGGAHGLLRTTDAVPIDWWRSPLIRGVTLAVVGSALWVRYWFGLQHTIEQGDEAARRAASRRIFLFTAVGISLVALIISLTVALFDFFQALLNGELARMTLREARWALAIALTSVCVAIYHFLVMREDQVVLRGAAVAEPARRHEVIILGGADADRAAEALAVAGEDVRIWRSTSARAAAGALNAEQLASLTHQVREAASGRIAVLLRGGEFEIVPFTEERR